MDISESDLDYALPHGRVSAAKHDIFGMVPADLVGTLRKNSQSRVNKDEEFVDLMRRIELYVQQKEQDVVSLDEDKFMARRKELDRSETR